MYYTRHDSIFEHRKETCIRKPDCDCPGYETMDPEYQYAFPLYSNLYSKVCDMLFYGLYFYVNIGLLWWKKIEKSLI